MTHDQALHEGIEDRSSRSRSSATWRDPVIALEATALAALTWWVLTGPLDITLAVPFDGDVREVELGAVIWTSALASLAGAFLLWVMEARLPRGRLLWTMVANVVLLVSLSGPATAETTEAMAGLALLHLVVGGAVIGGLHVVRRG